MTNTLFTRLPKLSALFIATAVVAGACTIPQTDQVVERVGESATSQDATEETEIIETEVSGISVTAEPANNEAQQTEESGAEVAYWAIEGVPFGLNVRGGPGVDSEILVQATRDRILTGTGETAGDWVQVTIDGVTGWAHGDYLAAADAPEPAASESTTATAHRTAGEIVIVANVPTGLNIRSGPSVDFEIVHGATLGTSGTATGNSADGWIEVTFEGVTGWAHSSYLEPVG